MSTLQWCLVVGLDAFLAGMGFSAWLTWRSLPARPVRCVYCGCEAFTWPKTLSNEFYEAHRCLSGQGHLYVHPMP